MLPDDNTGHLRSSDDAMQGINSRGRCRGRGSRRPSKRLALPVAIAACALLAIPGIASARSADQATRAVILAPFPFACEMVDEGAEARVYCWEGTGGRGRHVRLDTEGAVSLTATEPTPSGLGGPGLIYGGWLTVGRFRCEVLRKGIECVLISSGKGFLVNRSGIAEVQSTPGVAEPAPVFGESAAVEAVSGYVRVKEPGSKWAAPLNSQARVPMGSVLDTTHGTVQLSTAKGAEGEIQVGRFKGGLFKVTQPTGKSAANLPEGLTELTLTGALPDCGQAERASASARERRGKKRRLLWGDAHGNFTTGGRYAAATIGGTRWLTEDTCNGTRVKVTRGTVEVNDLVNHRTVSVTAGHTYLASTAAPPKNKVPVLGKASFRTKGFGHAHPREISFGGADPLFVVVDIQWRTWGPPRAVGRGTGWYLPPGTESVSEGKAEPAKIVAFDLGLCHGKLAYRKLQWFFPAHGGHFDPKRGNDVCH